MTFSIEADLKLSDTVVDAVDRRIRDMRRPSRRADRAPARVRERDLRYRIEIEMLPKSGVLRVTDEYLAALNASGEPTDKRKRFIERHGENIHLRLKGQAHPIRYDRYIDRTILSMPHYPPHCPHLVAARHKLESWLFFYFEPRERMRVANPIKEVWRIGPMGEELAAFPRTLQALEPRQFAAVEKALHVMMPNIDSIEVEMNDLGEAELRLKENGVAIPARVLSEGALRVLGLLALSGIGKGTALVGFEEPENGVHPRRIQSIAEMLNTRAGFGETQYIVTTHSPILPDLLPDSSLLAVRRDARRTRIDPFSAWGPLAYRGDIGGAPDDGDGEEECLPVSQRILRGDFDA